MKYLIFGKIVATSTSNSHRRCSVKKLFSETSPNSKENTCTRVSFLTKLQAETLAQVFSCQFCEVSENTFSTEHLRTTASTCSKFMSLKVIISYKVTGFFSFSKIPGFCLSPYVKKRKCLSFSFSSTNNKGQHILQLQLRLHKHFNIIYTPLNKLTLLPRKG